MVELRGIQMNQNGRAALMFWMAGFTTGHIRLSVIARFLRDIFFDSLVTGKTFFVKNLLNEVVTIQTLAFGLFVNVRHLSGHDALQKIQRTGYPPGRKDSDDNNEADFFPHEDATPPRIGS